MRKLIALLTSMLATTAFSQGVIDVHAHLLPKEFVEALKSEGRLMDEGFPLPKYDVQPASGANIRDGSCSVLPSLCLMSREPLKR